MTSRISRVRKPIDPLPCCLWKLQKGLRRCKVSCLVTPCQDLLRGHFCCTFRISFKQAHGWCMVPGRLPILTVKILCKIEFAVLCTGDQDILSLAVMLLAYSSTSRPFCPSVGFGVFAARPVWTRSHKWILKQAIGI